MFHRMITAWARLFTKQPDKPATRTCGTYLGLKLMGFDYPEEDTTVEYEAELIAMQRKSKQKSIIDKL